MARSMWTSLPKYFTVFLVTVGSLVWATPPEFRQISTLRHQVFFQLCVSNLFVPFLFRHERFPHARSQLLKEMDVPVCYGRAWLACTEPRTSTPSVLDLTDALAAEWEKIPAASSVSGSTSMNTVSQSRLTLSHGAAIFSTYFLWRPHIFGRMVYV